MKISTFALIITIIAVFTVTKFYEALQTQSHLALQTQSHLASLLLSALQILGPLSSLLLNITIILVLWMLSYILSRDFKFYLARACMTKSKDYESENAIETVRYLWRGLGYYNEYLGRNFGLKCDRLKFFNAIYKEARDTSSQSTLRTKLYESFRTHDGVNVDTMSPLKKIRH